MPSLRVQRTLRFLVIQLLTGYDVINVHMLMVALLFVPICLPG